MKYSILLNTYDYELTDIINEDTYEPYCEIYKWLWNTLGPVDCLDIQIECNSTLCSGTSSNLYDVIFKAELHYREIFPTYKLKNKNLQKKYKSMLFGPTYGLNILMTRLEKPSHYHKGSWKISYEKIGYDAYLSTVMFKYASDISLFISTHKDFIKKRRINDIKPLAVSG